ncbi:glycosyltransferase family protein 64 C3-like [Nicotiana tabacum]|uniref:Glycosyltransferase family protein 64 C3-like n=1 Tax=Nicotiana tabacum TaxID=4097 RepID=A0A1S3YQ60_TOBAC|nr:PREDICTED: glycosyltransferase family protein 64 C3-like [Nicotiana tabacum]
MKNQKPIYPFHVIIILSMPLYVFSLRIGPHYSDPCNRPPADPRTLQTDQMTVLINGYSEHRIPLLTSIAATYAAASSVAAVIILWSNPSTPSQTLTSLSQNLSSISTAAPISVLRQPSASLNLRFHPQKTITTRAVLICDDDIEPDSESINFAFQIWKSDPDRLIGFFVRSHNYDLTQKSWIYTMESSKYSIVLTKFMILKAQYLHHYTCSKEYEKLRAKVEEKNNCEDILMNFVVAGEVKKGPILVGAKKVRDWGDARNEGGEMEERDVGLSSRKREHRKRRGECIGEFHRLLGKMPLRYSYGKVVDSVGEQGLCDKGGNLVYCDRQIFQ